MKDKYNDYNDLAFDLASSSADYIFSFLDMLFKNAKEEEIKKALSLVYKQNQKLIDKVIKETELIKNMSEEEVDSKLLNSKKEK